MFLEARSGPHYSERLDLDPDPHFSQNLGGPWTLKMEAQNWAVEAQKMEAWRVCRPVAADPHHLGEEQDPDPHLSEKLDPDPLVYCT